MNIEEAKDMLINFRNYNKFFEDLTFLMTLEAKESIDKAIETILTAYEKEKEENEQWKKYATNDLENQITERNNKIFKLEAELEKEKEKNKNAIDFINERKKIVNKDMAEGTRLQVGTFMWQVDELLEILKGIMEE